MKYWIILSVSFFLFVNYSCAQNKAPEPLPSVSMSKDKVAKTEEQWKKELTDEEYRVLREKGTERPFTGEFDMKFDEGLYICAACGNPLFTSDTKYDAGCGWPSFSDAADNERVKLQADYSHGMNRTEVLCARCGSHLGHVFNDGPPPTGQRYCINSISLDFIPGIGYKEENADQ